MTWWELPPGGRATSGLANTPPNLCS